MARYRFRVDEAQQGMGHAPVAHADLRRLDQALADVAVSRRRAAHQQQVQHQVRILGNGFAVDGEPAGQRRRCAWPAGYPGWR